MCSLVLDQQCVTIGRSDSAESHTATLAGHNHADAFRRVYPAALAHTVQQEERALRSICVAAMVVFRDVQ
jgi:hypothetical protein